MEDPSHVDGDIHDVTKDHQHNDDNSTTGDEKNTKTASLQLKNKVPQTASRSSFDQMKHQEGIFRLICQTLKGLFRKHRGLLYILMACVFFAWTGVFVQLAFSVHVLLSSCFRGVILIVLPLIGFIFVHNRPTFSRTDILWILINSILHTNTQVCGFMAYIYIPVGDVNAILYSTPLFSGILAWIILKERLTLLDVALTFVSVAGVFLISKPAFIFGAEDDESGTDRLFGSLFAIGALVSASCVFVVTRKLRPFPANALVLTLAFGIVACPISAVLNTYIGKWCLPTDLEQTIYLLAVGVSGFLAILFFSLALETQKAVHISVTNTLTIIVTYVTQFFIFRIYPDIIAGIGAILICGSMFGVFISNWMTSKANRSESKVGGQYHSIIQREIDQTRELPPSQMAS